MIQFVALPVEFVAVFVPFDRVQSVILEVVVATKSGLAIDDGVQRDVHALEVNAADVI